MDLLTRDGAPPIGYDLSGDGPPLLLVHGITESARSWDPLLPRLAEGHRVLRVDLRGHGTSGGGETYGLDELADDVVAVLSHVGLDRPLAVGHSLGGFTVSVLAARHPVRGVVNVDQPLALGAFKEALGEVEPLLRSEAFGQVITQMFDGYMAPLADEETARLSALRRPDQQAVLGIWETVFASSAEDLDALVRQLVGGIDAPYLAIHGEDPGPEYRAWLADVVPQAEVQVIPGSAHYPHLHDPDGFLDRLAAFEAGLS